MDQSNRSAVVDYISIIHPSTLEYRLVMCSVSTNGERASLANMKLTKASLLECS